MTTPPPTSPARKTRKVADRTLSFLVWTTNLGAAAVELTLLSPMVPHHHVQLADVIQFYMSAAVLQLTWIWCLASERANRFNRRKVRLYRRMGWFVQALYLTFLAIGTWPTKHFTYAAEGALFLAIAITLWLARAATEALHPDDQKIIDQVIAEEEELLDARLREEAERLREARLNEALAHVRRYTIPTPPSDPQPNPKPTPKWQVQKGRHAPVVYFIRNGNRIKIGTTTDLYQRIRRLALRADDVLLLLSGGRELERDMHRRFTSLRVGNTEWFRDAQPLSDFITSHLERLHTTKGSDDHE